MAGEDTSCLEIAAINLGGDDGMRVETGSSQEPTVERTEREKREDNREDKLRQQSNSNSATLRSTLAAEQSKAAARE